MGQVNTDSSGVNVEGLLKQILIQLQARPTGNEKLAAAYVKARAEIGSIVAKNAHNGHFKSNFADLSAVLMQIEGPFAANGLALLQAPGKMSADGRRIELVGVLFHDSGQSLSVTMELPIGDKSTAQAAGSAITYARRYQAQSIGGIAPVDDDGEFASYQAPGSAPPAPPKKDKKADAEKAPAKEEKPKAKKAKEPEPEPESEDEGGSSDEESGDREELRLELLEDIEAVTKLEVMRDLTDGSLRNRVIEFDDDEVASAFRMKRQALEKKGKK